MTTSDGEQAKSGRWQRIWQQQNKWYWLYMPVGGIMMFFVGIIFWGGFHTALELTNTEEFCTSCHEMRDNVYQEYKKSVHYKNHTGVRATCPDCHVPRVWAYKIMVKLGSARHLLHKVLGTIDTREKFLAHREELAKLVWDNMKATNSRECRNCHAQSFMDIDNQDRMAKKAHVSMDEEGKTCIDCHKGIAHRLPGTE